jgi:hypothetical protein
MLAALAAAGLIASSGAAGAATASGPIISSAPIWAAADSGQSTASVTYSCNAGLGVGALNIDATLSVPAVASEGEAATIALAAHATALSALSSGLLSKLVSVGVAGTARVGSASGEGVVLAGHARLAAGDATQSPSVMAVGKLALTTAGTTTVFVPPTITVTLSALTQVLVSLQCKTSSTAVEIDVPAPASSAPSGPVYTCTDGSSRGSIDAPLPLAVSATGLRVTGSTETVTLSSPDSGLGAPYPSGTSALAFSGSLLVTGAQQGSISLSRHTTVLTDKTFSVLGQLYLEKPGTYHILLPSRFTFTISGTKNTYLSCALKTSPAPTGLTLTVTGEPTAGGQGGTAATGALPAGAPNTGGGSGPGSNLPMIAGGAALLLIGGAGFVFAARRRRLGQPSS